MYNSNNWGTWKASNYYKNDKVDSLLDKALRITEQAKRAKLYQEAARIVVETRRACGSITRNGTGHS